MRCKFFEDISIIWEFGTIVEDTRSLYISREHEELLVMIIGLCFPWPISISNNSSTNRLNFILETKVLGLGNSIHRLSIFSCLSQSILY